VITSGPKSVEVLNVSFFSCPVIFHIVAIFAVEPVSAAEARPLP
jgi:hypothetical protein